MHDKIQLLEQLGFSQSFLEAIEEFENQPDSGEQIKVQTDSFSNFDQPVELQNIDPQNLIISVKVA